MRASANPLQRAAAMTRYVLLALLCLGASVARADDSTPLPGGATVSFQKLFVHANPTSSDLTEVPLEGANDVRDKYFNFAHCVCSQSVLSDPSSVIPNFTAFEFVWRLTVMGFTIAIDQPLEIWVGNNCNDDL